MSTPTTSWYIATVWVGLDAYDVGERFVMRLPATDVADYQRRVRARVDHEFATPREVQFGAVSLSKVQS